MGNELANGVATRATSLRQEVLSSLQLLAEIDSRYEHFRDQWIRWTTILLFSITATIVAEFIAIGCHQQLTEAAGFAGYLVMRVIITVVGIAWFWFSYSIAGGYVVRMKRETDALVRLADVVRELEGLYKQEGELSPLERWSISVRLSRYGIGPSKPPER